MPTPAAPPSAPGSSSGISGEPEARYFRSIARLGLQAAEALAHAHGQGVLHRDIKPSNLLLDGQGTLWITDFGLAKAEDSGDITRTGDIVGTVRYMAPERFKGKADARSDVYALAVTLYEMLALRPPFSGRDQVELIGQITEATPPPLHELASAVPRDLETIVAKGMARDPDLRYRTATALADDLRAFLEHRPIQARRASALEQFRRWCRRNPLAAGLAATAALSLLVVAIVTSTAYLVTSAALKQTEQERERALDNYYDSLIGEARGLRLARVTGYREQAWKLLNKARQLVTSHQDVSQLRREAAACLGDPLGLEPTIWIYPEGEQVEAIAFRPGSTELAVGLSDGTVSVCNRVTHSETARLRGHACPLTVVASSADGKLWVSGDQAGTIKVWERKADGTWTLRRSMAADHRPVDFDHQRLFLAITPDGRQLASCCAGGSVVALWDLLEGTRITQLSVPAKETLHCLAMSTDGKRIAAGFMSHGTGPDGILLWDVPTRRRSLVVLECSDYPRQVAFSPDGRWLASACGDGGVLLFATSNFQRHLSFGGDFPVGVTFSPDSRVLAITYNQTDVIRLVDVASSREAAVVRHPGQPHTVAFSTDGKMLVTADARSIRAWSLAGTGEKILLAGHDGAVPAVAFSPDGKLLVSVGKDHLIKVWDCTTGEAIHQLTGSSHSVQTVAFGADGCLLAAADWNGTIRIWEVGSWQLLVTDDRDLPGQVWEVTFSPDGKHFAACGDPGGVILWRVVLRQARGKTKSLTLERVARLPNRIAISTEFSPDSRLLAWVEWPDASLHFWDLENSRMRPSWPTRLVNAFYHVSFHPDGKHLVFIGPSRVPEMWNLDTQQKVFALTTEQLDAGEPVFTSGTIKLSADGTWLAQGGSALRVWDLQTKKLLLTLPEERSSGLAWSPNKQLLAAGLSDGTIAIWNLPRIRSQLSEISLGW